MKKLIAVFLIVTFWGVLEAETGRFQIYIGSPDGTNTFLLDTDNGRVWMIVEDELLERPAWERMQKHRVTYFLRKNGIVGFPDTMTDEEIQEAIRKLESESGSPQDEETLED